MSRGHFVKEMRDYAAKMHHLNPRYYTLKPSSEPDLIESQPSRPLGQFFPLPFPGSIPPLSTSLTFRPTMDITGREL